MDSKRLPKVPRNSQTHQQIAQPASTQLPLPANQENLIGLQALIGNQAVQRLMRPAAPDMSAALQRQEEEEYAATGSDPVVLDEMEIPAGGGADGPMVLDEMEVPVDGGAGGQVSEGEGGPVILDEMETSAGGGGSGDHIAFPEDHITAPGGGESTGSGDHITFPEDHITASGGDSEGVGPTVNEDNSFNPNAGPTVNEDNIAFPEDQITAGGTESESGGWLENMWNGF